MFQQELTILSSIVSNKRLEHCLRVANTAKEIAKQHNYDENEAFLCGLLHDCAKEIEIGKYDIEFSENDMKFYSEFNEIWHAFVVEKVGAYFFPMHNLNIFKAAKFHSTGAKSMSLLAKIIFVSDYIEPGRSYIQDSALKDLAFVDLNKAVFEVAQKKLHYLVTKKQKIHHYLFECYNFYQS